MNKSKVCIMPKDIEREVLKKAAEEHENYFLKRELIKEYAEKVIKLLKTEQLGDSELMELAKQMGAAALEKQIPKKPICDGWGGFLKLCPNCKSKAIYDHKNLEPRKHCDNCGQALDWSKNDT